MRTVVGRAPVRIDLAGGTLDLWPIPFTLPEATTLNVALDLPAVVEVTRGPASSGAAVRLVARPPRAFYGPRAVDDETRADGTLRVDLPGTHVDPDAVPDGVRLLYRAVAAIAPEGGVRVVASTTSPIGAGLGGSSALLACAVTTLAKAVDRPLAPADAARVAQDLETAHLRTPTGYQDYYPPLFGGCLALSARPGRVEVERLAVPLDALARRLRLVYTGVPHHSGWTNWAALRAYLDGEPGTVAALRSIADRAVALRQALRDVAADPTAPRRLDAALELMVEEGRARAGLAPGVVTPAIARLDAAARAAGALGTKVCGAGGGGCVLIVLRGTEAPPGLASALHDLGARELPLRLTAQGVSVRDAVAAEVVGWSETAG